MSLTLKSGGNTSMTPRSRSDPRSSYKCYFEMDIRHQSLKKVKGSHRKHPPKTLYSKVSSTISNCTSSWSGLPKNIPQEPGEYRSSEIQKLRTSPIQEIKSSIAGVRNRSQTSNSQRMKKQDRTAGKYDNLTYAQKVEMIVNDEIQWLKLKQSLREAGALWSNFAAQQVLHEHVQKRIDEMEQLELAMYEFNKNRSLRNSNLPIFSEEEKKLEEQGAAGPIMQLTKNYFPQVLLLRRVNKSWLKSHR